MNAMLEAPDRVLSTLNRDGSRRWLRPVISSGRFLKARLIAAWALIGLFVALPFIRINGKPALLLDIAAREFTFFGFTLLATDTLLFALFLIICILSVFLLTALFGRIWCGWACPQTVYMEFLYRPIERLIDGPPNRLGKPRYPAAAWRTILKFTLFVVASFALANLFIAYFIGVERLGQWMRSSPFEHPTAFAVMAVTTGLMLFNFGYFREQTCILACPYGRLQSVLLDKQSLIISYDTQRGEPRGKFRSENSEFRNRQSLPVLPTTESKDHGETSPASRAQVGVSEFSIPTSEIAAERSGDCVDCGLCVVTCPTGIDIRNGLQLECVGCAQCIDACDDVMDKIRKPRGLIRYSSQAAIAGEKASLLRPRVILYPVILTVLTSIFALLLITKQPADVTLLGGLGATFTELPDGRISNAIRIKIRNRTDHEVAYHIEIISPAGAELSTSENPLVIVGGAQRTDGVMILAPASVFVKGRAEARLRINDGAKFSREVTYRLLGPASPSAGGNSP